MQAPHTTTARSATGLPATFTELTSAGNDRGKFPGKRIFRDGSIAGEPKITFWSSKQVTINNIEALFAYVQAAQQREVCIIRGLADHLPGQAVRRKKVRNPDDPTDTGFHDVPQAWAAFDFDEVKLPVHADFLREPHETIDHIVSALIGDDVSYVIALTSTCGLAKSEGRWAGHYDFTRVRFRLLVMLDRPISCHMLAAWSHLLCADRQLAHVVQPIYIARPRWLKKPGTDILASTGLPTCWLVRRQNDVVPTPSRLEHEARWQAAEGAGALGENHPDVNTAISKIGTDGHIHPHLLCAVRLLCHQYPRDENTSVETHARRINVTLIERLAQSRAEVCARLAHCNRAWAEVEEKLRNDTWRYAEWVLRDSPTAKNGKYVRRSKVNRQPPPLSDLHHCRQHIFESIKAWEADARKGKNTVRIVSAPTGSGKSTLIRGSAIRAVDEADEGNIFIGIPHHRLSEELVATFAQDFPDKNIGVAIWRGRQADDPLQPGHKMCWRPDDVKAAVRAGANANALCKVKVKGHGEIQCPFFLKCGYQRQKQQNARIWLGAHEMLVHEKPEALGEIKRIYLDEGFVDAFLFGVESPVELPLDVLGETCPDLAKERLDLLAVFNHLPDGPVAKLPRKFSKDLCDRMYRLEWKQKYDPEISPTMPADKLAEALKKAEAQNWKVKCSAMLWQLLGEFAEAPYQRSGRLTLVTRKGKRYVQMCGLGKLTKGWEGAPILITDATADIEMIRAIWPHTAENANNALLPTPHTSVYQIVDGPFSKDTFAPNDASIDPDDPDRKGDKNVRRAAKVRELYAAALARAIAFRLQYPDKPVALITYKAAEEWILQNCQGQIPAWLHIAYFGQVTGVNNMSDVSLLIVAGRPLPPWDGASRIAGALWGEGIDGGNYALVDANIATVKDCVGNNTATVSQYRHPDPKVERVRRHICEGALMQAVGRGRGILRTADNPLTIELWTDVPLPELGDVIPRLWSEVRPTLDEVMMAAHGIILSNSVHAANVAPEIVASANALRKSREREVSDIPLMEVCREGKCHQPLDLPPPDPMKVPLDCVQYRLSGPGQRPNSATLLTTVSYLSSEWLFNRFGNLAEFQRLEVTDFQVTIESGGLGCPLKTKF